MFYNFRQNNSGGGFAGPAVNVIIEASSPSEANMLAEEIGLYFDGSYDDGPDCPCCGDRWYHVADYDADSVPSIYGEAINLEDKSVAEPTGDLGDFTKSSAKADKVLYVKIFFKDGSTYEA